MANFLRFDVYDLDCRRCGATRSCDRDMVGTTNQSNTGSGGHRLLYGDAAEHGSEGRSQKSNPPLKMTQMKNPAAVHAGTVPPERRPLRAGVCPLEADGASIGPASALSKRTAPRSGRLQPGRASPAPGRTLGWAAQHRPGSYGRLRDAVLASSSSPLLVFPSASDADSLCALKIVTHVLSSDSIRDSIHPVSSFGEINKFAGDELHSDQSLTLLLINWGCHRDIRRFLNLGPKVHVFVIDSHRPIHLHNLSEQNKHVVLYTQEDEHQADLAYDFDEIDVDSDSDEDDDEGRNRKRQRVSQDSESDPIKLFGKLKSEYYKLGTFHGRPSGCLMFELAHSLRKNTNELLWLACVSLTDQFVHERLTNERYQAGVMELEQHINSSGNLDAVSSVTLRDGTKIQAPANSRIAYEDEPRPVLLREWNLFDSMLCSSYIATKLKTWSEKGLKNLKFLLARMGFPLAECQKKFQYMSMEVKQKMKDMFDSFLPEYGLTEFYYRSFLRIHGYLEAFVTRQSIQIAGNLFLNYLDSTHYLVWCLTCASNVDCLGNSDCYQSGNPNCSMERCLRGLPLKW
ncbi:hypothetical protein Cni_G24949 [Canna indica]|uniref:Cell division control protein 45 homolog n=1 Tax=Canna indica TaxID=4628 RepID=A0AAQ3KW58_9LILI|nr:hypothetical protein Cni_G24949 [Canna indica]